MMKGSYRLGKLVGKRREGALRGRDDDRAHYYSIPPSFFLSFFPSFLPFFQLGLLAPNSVAHFRTRKNRNLLSFFLSLSLSLFLFSFLSKSRDSIHPHIQPPPLPGQLHPPLSFHHMYVCMQGEERKKEKSLTRKEGRKETEEEPSSSLFFFLFFLSFFLSFLPHGGALARWKHNCQATHRHSYIEYMYMM